MITNDDSLSKLGMDAALKIVALDIGDDLREVHESFIRSAKVIKVLTDQLSVGIMKADEEGSKLQCTRGDVKLWEYLDNSLIPLMKLEKELSEVVENYNDIYSGFMGVAMPKAWNSAASQGEGQTQIAGDDDQ